MANKFLDQNGLLYFWQQIKNKLSNKVDVEVGKGLSTEDYTTAEKTKLANIADGANKTTVENVLTSTSTTNALSAAQGKALSDRIDGVVENMGDLGYGDMMKDTYDADNDGKVDQALHAEQADQATNATKAADADKLGGQAPAYYAKAADIPTSTSELTNDSGFITNASVPTKVSALENDAAYITAAAIPTKVSAFTNDAGYLTAHQDITGKLDKTGDGSNVTATFTQASTRANIATGEKMSTIMGKIAKYFADLKTVAFTGSYNDLSNKPAIPTVTNDLTDELKANYDAAYTHSQQAHAPANAQANVIETIQVNGANQTVSGKAVNIAVPTTVAQLTDAANYALKSDLTSVYKYMGSVDTEAQLPTSDVEVGHVYDIVADSSYGAAGMNVAWNGTKWDALGEVFTIDSITTAEIDAILAA